MPRKNKQQLITGSAQPKEQPSEEEAQVRAALAERKERREREAACLGAVEAALAEHKCILSPVFKMGEQTFPTSQLVNLPVMVTIVSQ